MTRDNSDALGSHRKKYRIGVEIRLTHRASERLLRLIIHGSWNQRRPNRTWAHTVHPDPVLNLLVRETASESYNCSLSGGVVKQVGTTDVVVHRSACDDRVAALHLWEHVFGEEKEGVDVGIEGFDPLFPLFSSALPSP